MHLAWDGQSSTTGRHGVEYDFVTRFATVNVGADPDATWTDQAWTTAEAGGRPLFSVVSDGTGDGHRWTEAFEAVITGRDPGVTTAPVTIGHKRATLIEGLVSTSPMSGYVWPASDV